MEMSEFFSSIADNALEFIDNTCSFEKSKNGMGLKLKAVGATAAMMASKEVENIYIEQLVILKEVAKLFADQVEEVYNPYGLTYTLIDMVAGHKKEDIPAIVEKYNTFMELIDGKKFEVEFVINELEFDEDGIVC